MLRGRGRRTVALLLGAALSPAPAQGFDLPGEWDIVPRFAIGATWTDNLRLTETNRESSTVLTQTPGLSVRGRSRRLQLNFDYNLQNRIFLEDSSLNGLDNQLAANATAELWQNHLFFDAQANVGRQNVNNFGPLTNSPLLDTGNTAQIINYSLGPRFVARLSDFATFNASYRYNDTTASDNAQGFGGAGQAVTAQLTSGPRFGRLGWGLSINHRIAPGVQGGGQAGVQNGGDATFTNGNAQVSYRFTRTLQGFANAGYAQNNFQSQQGTQQSGVTWSAGGTWTPTPRTSITGSYGQQPFGNVININASHRQRRWQASLLYNETLITVPQILLERQQFILVDEQGRPFIDLVNNSFVVIDFDIPRLVNDVLIQRRLNATLSYQLRRGALTLVGFHDDRTFEAVGDSEQVYGLRLNLNYSLSPRLSPNVGMGWQQGTSSAQGRGTFNRYDFNVAMNYTFGPSLTGSLNYNYLQGDGVAGNLAGGGFGGGGGGFGAPGGFGVRPGSGSYYENRITAFLTFLF